ncbi:MAG TPA: autotransporter-associated beta strand repeat-containing protein, partial [Candidatus Sulfotelmatobacter sp.]|nr:autotransporter-associated beta strand repeat-containing protein [Candidatus Sulfotelmatobacter sp.]
RPELHLDGTAGNISLDAGIAFLTSSTTGAVVNEGGDNVINGSFYLTDGGGDTCVAVNSGTLTLTGPIAPIKTSRNLRLGGSGNGTVTGVISDQSTNSSYVLGLIKQDAGTWSLQNSPTHSGTTTIQGGTLALAAWVSLANTPTINLLSNATFDVSAQSGGFALSATRSQTLMGNGSVVGNVSANINSSLVAGTKGGIGTLAFANDLTLTAAMTNYFDLVTDPTPGSGINDLVTVGGNLEPNGATISLNILAPLTPGRYRLFNYAGTKFSSFNPVVLAPASRYNLSLDESVQGQVDLVVGGNNTALTWYGSSANNTWDLTNNANWNLNSEKFYQADTVLFDDTSATNVVTLSGTLQPGAVVVNAATNYLFQGSGKISSVTGFTKSGTGSLTNNVGGSDFAGPVTVNGGTLSVGIMTPNGSVSALGSGTSVTLDGGTLQYTGTNLAAAYFNRLFSLGAGGGTVDLNCSGSYVFITNLISGSGALTKAGAKQLIIGEVLSGKPAGATNTYDGVTYANVGEIQMRGPFALGSTVGKTVVASGADVAAGGGWTGTVWEDFDLSGNGPSANGALQVNDGGTAVTFAGKIALVANASVGGASPMTVSGPVSGPGNLAKFGANTVTLNGTNTFAGYTHIVAGTLQMGNGDFGGNLG